MTTETKEFTCKEHGPYTGTVYHIMGRDIVPNCPACLEGQEKESRMRREAIINDERIRWLKENTPPIMWNATFDDISERPREKAIKKFIKEWQDLKKIGASMALLGGYGTGKSSAACVVGSEIHARYGEKVVYINASDMVRDVRSTYDKPGVSEKEIVSFYMNVPLLIIDELGWQGNGTSDRTLMTEIISRRHANLKPTILIANGVISELAQILGDQLMDRMRQNYMSVTFEGSSKREKKSWA